MREPSPLRAVPLHAVTVFLSAFLLFLVQPMLGRFILPWFGGSPGVWTTCLLFFQTLLLLGYAWAHAIVRLSPRRQAWLHSLLLAGGLLLLPVTPAESWKEGAAAVPTARILALLTASVGGPYLALAATGPLLQAWFARVHPGRSPYWLYALSNLGSLLALVAYPLAVETTLPLRIQTGAWSAAFALFAALCAAAAWQGSQAPPLLDPEPPRGGVTPERRFGTRDLGVWLLLSALPSATLLAATNQICQDVASVPFLWVLPLGLYLVTFILCFGTATRDLSTGAGGLAMVAVTLAAIALGHGSDLSLVVQVAAHSAALFFGCLACNAVLVKRRPGPRHLTSFYLSLSLGGVLGAVFVALVAPRVFDDFLEYPLALLGCFAVGAAALTRGLLGPAAGRRASLAAAMGVAALCALLAFELDRAVTSVRSRVLLTRRDFYGVFRVTEDPLGRPLRRMRGVWSGKIKHGLQFLAPERRRWAVGYHGPDSGVGLALNRHPGRREGDGTLRIGVLGLGAGVLAVYAERGDRVRFYEISPIVAEIAETWFSYLPDARGRGAEVDTVLGDARVALEDELAAGSPGRFDLLAVDAFSGDAVPVHLLTREAFEVYRGHLGPGGVLAINVSNLHLDLDPVVRALARESGLTALRITNRGNPALGEVPATWWLLAEDPQRLASPPLVAASDAGAASGRTLLWTDDRSSLLGVLR